MARAETCVHCGYLIRRSDDGSRWLRSWDDSPLCPQTVATPRITAGEA